jgi:NAD(P)-dependent dehydrogenase (short-subunit alcohol dehydrogenase family)
VLPPSGLEGGIRGPIRNGWRRIDGPDAMAPALLIAEFARRHRARGGAWGRIVGLTSGGQHGFPDEVSYGAAKAAQENYTMSASVELAPYGVTANIVYPPVTDTGWVPTRCAPPSPTAPSSSTWPHRRRWPR